MFKIFEFKGNKINLLPSLNPKNIKGILIIFVVTISISILTGWLKIEEKDLWKIYTAIIQKFGLTSDIPNIKNNEKKLDAKIELEVDRAINEYKRLTNDDGLVKIPPPIYSEKPIDEELCYTDECKSLGGEMRLCSPWVENCKNTFDQ